MKLSGIYRIKNIITGDCYVGSSVHIEKRWKEHKNAFKANRHTNTIMQNSYNKYGEESFKYEIFEICPTEYLLEREQERLDSGAFKFNICLSAVAPMIGRKHSDETRAKMSFNRKGRKLSEETKAKLSAAGKGNTNNTKGSPGNRLGIKSSAESRAKMSAAAKEAWARKKTTSNNNKEEI